jgi:hypothetical protein
VNDMLGMAIVQGTGQAEHVAVQHIHSNAQNASATYGGSQFLCVCS